MPAAKSAAAQRSRHTAGQRQRAGDRGELGEIAELLKKDKYHSKPLDKQDLLKEAGDLLWYMALYSDVTGYAFALLPAEDCYTAPQHLFQLLRIIEALSRR